MVGHDVCAALESRGEVLRLTKSDLDITDAPAVREAVRRVRPDVIVNCAAYTKVDEAETHEKLARAINGTAVESLAHAANDADALLVQISTDFVFDGSKETPYEVGDLTNPLSVYGHTKLEGEQAAAIARKHIVLRTAWLFGVHGKNFVKAIRTKIREGKTPVPVVNDQCGRPTYTPHLANAIVLLAQRAYDDENARGIVHYADEPECTWFDFARAFAGDDAVTPVSSDTMKRAAKRPAYSVLSTERYERITGVKPESWEEGLREYLKQLP
jgi:dTDP-4-dehydrorhamnose reductase